MGESGIKRVMIDLLYGNVLTVFVRVFLGGMLVFSGYFKALDFESFGKVIALYDILPVLSIAYMAIIIPVLEVLVGICLIVGLKIRAASLISMILMTVFAIAIGVNVVRGKNFECGCFELKRLGMGFNETISVWLVIRDIIFLAGFTLMFRTKRHLFSLENHLERMRLKNLERSKYE